MEDLMNISQYREFKAAMDIEMKRSAEGFVRIGYLLRKAKDTSVLAESGYKSVVDFAKAEYNIDKTQVSRFIAINERYSVDGYSDRLKPQYERFGLAKLQEILLLPDSIAEELTPEMTRETIQDVKKEYKEELEKTDIEVMLEEKNITEETMLYQAMYILFHDDTNMFEAMYKLACGSRFNNIDSEEIIDTLSPSGVMARFARIAGVGKIFITIKQETAQIVATNGRNNEKEAANLLDLLKWFIARYAPAYAKDYKDVWQQMYNEPFPEKKKEPVQVEQREENKEKRLVNKPVEKHLDHKEKAKKENVEKKQPENTAPKEPESRINTPIENASTTIQSTQDNRAIVFGEMRAVGERLMECLSHFDENGVREHVKELQGILDSMAADNGKDDIPGQMSIEETIG